MDALPTSDNTAVPVVPAAASAATRAGDQGLFLIAIFELVKTVLFIIAALGVFHLVKRDATVELKPLLHALRINGDRAFIQSLLHKANDFSIWDKRFWGGVLLLYAALHATEGIGLLLRRRWAEYFTVIMTAIPLPFEVYLLAHHTAHIQAAQGGIPAIFSRHVYLLKIALFVINLGIVAFLAYHLRRGLQLEHARASAAGTAHGAALPAAE